MPLDEFVTKYIVIPGNTVDGLVRIFCSIVNQCRSQCTFFRGQWHIPKYTGFNRIVRQRTTQEVEASRTAHPTDSNELRDLMQAGQQSLTRFMSGIPQVADSHTFMTTPDISVRPEDQPQITTPGDVLLDNVCREVPL